MIPNRPNPYANLQLAMPQQPVQMANFAPMPELPKQQSDNSLQQVFPTGMNLLQKFLPKSTGAAGGAMASGMGKLL